MGSTKPSRTNNPRRRKSEEPAVPPHRTRAAPGTRHHAGYWLRRNDEVGRGLAVRQPGQRERERERRVSDADASYNGPRSAPWTLIHAMPMKPHAKLRLPHRSDPAPSPMTLKLAPAGKPVKGNPNQTYFRFAPSRVRPPHKGDAITYTTLYPNDSKSQPPQANFS